MLTGQVPFDGPTNNDIMLRHLEDPLLDPRKIYSQIQPSLVRVLYKLLAKKSSDRYDSTDQLVEDLEHILNSEEPPYATQSTVFKPVSVSSKNSKSGCLTLCWLSACVVYYWSVR
jgi:serine/threonine protein kinase